MVVEVHSKANWNWVRGAGDLTFDFCSVSLLRKHEQTLDKIDIGSPVLPPPFNSQVDTYLSLDLKRQVVEKTLCKRASTYLLPICTYVGRYCPSWSAYHIISSPRLSSFPARLGVLLITLEDQDSVRARVLR